TRSSNASQAQCSRVKNAWLLPNPWPPAMLGQSKAQFPLPACEKIARGGTVDAISSYGSGENEQNEMHFRLRPQVLFKLLRQRRNSPPNLWQFGPDVRDVIAARTLLAMAGKLSAAEARRMVEEKRLALVRAQIACTDGIIKGRSPSAARDYFDVYNRAVESNRKRLRHRGRRWPRLRF